MILFHSYMYVGLQNASSDLNNPTAYGSSLMRNRVFTYDKAAHDIESKVMASVNNPVYLWVTLDLLFKKF